LTQREGSITQHGIVTTSVGGDATQGRGKGGDGVGWADANLSGQKMKKIHMIDSASTNER
jgi:hypothetical protein